ncbi:metallophosphoesterase [uncultured Tateyamaria sp.]|uniref:metallophosphoesterase n=1 Tax=uncultured Tateyamaria sp. TaxID=455651 RepID=UPI002624E6D2|nr:metallophosphoesterase [uncultured Tateyamaria sp.]
MTRRGFLKGLLGTILAGLFASLYTFFIEPALRLQVKRWHLTPEVWPSGRKLRIAAISDLHVGEPYVGLSRVRQVVRRANALGADMIVLLGDYAAGHHFITKDVKIEDVAPVLADLKAPLGVFAILGNHDWWDDLSAQRRGGGPNLYADALERVGIPCLSNHAVKTGGVWVAGLEDQLALRGPTGQWVGLDDLPGTLAQVTDDDPVILLAHEPDIFVDVPSRVAVTLSGHTHGGQVRLFGWSPVVPSRYGNRFAYGHVEEDGRHLVVSGGIGCSILPVRLGSVPEITVIEIG